MGESCLRCGDMVVGEMVYCFKCMQLAFRHSNPTNGEIIRNWLCPECESTDRSSSKKPKKRKHQKISEESDRSGGFEKNNNFLCSFAGSRARITNPGLFDSIGMRQEEEEFVTYAEPLIRSVWTGMFDMVSHDESNFRVMHDVQAFLSSKACKNVREVASLFRPVLRFEKVSRLNVWPKGFICRSGPTDDSIGVYFFPLLGNEENYDHLVFEMVRDDLAMRASLGDAELLVFASTVLPDRFWRFQGRLYLWGVFRGKRTTEDVY
ncbi:hypothetical protein CASFOL_019861 [Castilleja foliolosa]|uniref:AIPP2-like SPOC-like domain-containing protein n=1 Tax=Castilleja foliolosa TaxID=1961234 RepID=A0ABD3D1Y8_9LAMI